MGSSAPRFRSDEAPGAGSRVMSEHACVLLFQIIQRQLEQVEEKQRQLEERGVAVEKALRGEAGNILSNIHHYY